MGFNTTILILNDGLDQIRKNPEAFVESLYHKIASGEEGDVGVGGHVNVAHVMRTQHADAPRLYLTMHNTIIEVGEYGTTADNIKDGKVSHYKDWLERAGRIAYDRVKAFRKLLRETS